MRFAGWGRCVPSRIVTNRDLIRFFQMNDGGRFEAKERPLSEEEALELTIGPEADALDNLIQKMTGIRQRHWCNENETAITLGERAARNALRVGRVRASKVGAVICASETNPVDLPCLASLIANRLGVKKALCFDIRAACCGFLLSLQTARALLESYQYVLVIASEALSSHLDTTDTNTTMLFGDGAGALLITRGSEVDDLFHAVGVSEPDKWDILRADARAANSIIKMDGRRVVRTSLNGMREETLEAIKKARIRLRDIDHFFFHQNNVRITEDLMKSLDIPPHKVYTNIYNYGNTSAASIPLALCEAMESGILRFGDTIAMAATGAGMTSVATVVRWLDGRPKPSRLRRNTLASLLRARRKLASLTKKWQSIIRKEVTDIITSLS